MATPKRKWTKVYLTLQDDNGKILPDGFFTGVGAESEVLLLRAALRSLGYIAVLTRSYPMANDAAEDGYVDIREE